MLKTEEHRNAKNTGENIVTFFDTVTLATLINNNKEVKLELQ